MRKKEETMEVVMLCVPTEMLREAGIRERSVLENVPCALETNMFSAGLG